MNHNVYLAIRIYIGEKEWFDDNYVDDIKSFTKAFICTIHWQPYALSNGNPNINIHLNIHLSEISCVNDKLRIVCECESTQMLFLWFDIISFSLSYLNTQHLHRDNVYGINCICIEKPNVFVYCTIVSGPNCIIHHQSWYFADTWNT